MIIKLQICDDEYIICIVHVGIYIRYYTIIRRKFVIIIQYAYINTY